jgi:hypothetical protein
MFTFDVIQLARQWGPTLGIWGVGAGTAALFVRLDSPTSFCLLSFFLNHDIVVICHPGCKEGSSLKHSAGEVLPYHAHTLY